MGFTIRQPTLHPSLWLYCIKCCPWVSRPLRHCSSQHKATGNKYKGRLRSTASLTHLGSAYKLDIGKKIQMKEDVKWLEMLEHKTQATLYLCKLGMFQLRSTSLMMLAFAAFARWANSSTLSMHYASQWSSWDFGYSWLCNSCLACSQGTHLVERKRWCRSGSGVSFSSVHLPFP